MTQFDRQSAERIARRTRLSERSLTPLHRVKTRRDRPGRSGTTSFFAVITGLIDLPGKSNRTYSYARLMESEDEPSRPIPDPDAPVPNDESWQDPDAGAMHLRQSIWVPNGTIVEIHRAMGGLIFDVNRALRGRIVAPLTVETDTLNRLSVRSYTFRRVYLVEDLWFQKPNAHSQTPDSDEPAPNDVVFSVSRLNYLRDAIFTAIWAESRYEIIAIDPQMQLVELPTVDVMGEPVE